ncbi:MAG: Nramp family divalent metal transporter [Methanobacteriota archaeon]
MRRAWGPGFVVTAAFVGPGTVTTAMLAGARFGPALLWAVLLSTLVTVVLQEATARFTIASGKTLGEALPDLAASRTLRRVVTGLVLVAVVFGAAAFETGNLLGTSVAVESVSGAPRWVTLVAAADVAFLLLWFGRTAAIERVLAGLVAVMAVAFLADLFFLPVAWGEVARGFVPTLPDRSLLLVVALVGTTVVPYNLFLHGSLVKRHGWGVSDLGRARLDLAAAIGLGGLLTAALVVTAATALPGAEPTRATELAAALEPVAGRGATLLFALGLFAASITSAITAPLAAAFVAAHALGFPDDFREPRFRLAWIGVLGAGLVAAVYGATPFAAIVLAQAANGLLLPIVAAALLFAVNRRDLVGARRNGWFGNALGGAALLVSVGLAAALLFGV